MTPELRVLMAHNYYQIPGGEGRSFKAECELLRANGHHVSTYTRHNDEIHNLSSIRTAIDTHFSMRTYREVRRLIRADQIQLLHCQNTFPLISPAIYYAAADCGVPVVQHIRNYRLVCPTAVLFRDGGPCYECVGRRLPTPAIQHRCYRGSLAASVVAASYASLHRLLGTWSRHVGAFICLNSFTAGFLATIGISPERVFVRPNFIWPPGGPHQRSTIGDYALYVGRLSEEKGIRFMLESWPTTPSVPLKIAGTGELKDDLHAVFGGHASIEFLGQVEGKELERLMSGARMLVFPSLWLEGQPRSIIEALQAGVPVVASDLGAMREMLAASGAGRLFRPGDPDSFRAALLAIWSNEATALAMSKAAALQFARDHSVESAYSTLRRIYDAALAG